MPLSFQTSPESASEAQDEPEKVAAESVSEASAGPSPVAAGRSLGGGKYVIKRHLATGGMAELFLAEQRGANGFRKEVVIKQVHGRYLAHPQVMQMFLQESQLVGALSHPGIVAVTDVGEEDGAPFAVMEYVAGHSLWAIARHGIETHLFLPLEQAIHIVCQVCEALAYVHTRTSESGIPLGIVHRDISPSNVLVSYDGAVKIIDFGIATAQGSTTSSLGSEPSLVAGKRHYMAPEALRGEKVDARADVWSCGVILWELVLGQRLFKGSLPQVLRQVLDEKVTPPTFVRRDVPAALEQIILRALEKHPEDRYASAVEMVAELDVFRREHPCTSSSLALGEYMQDLFSRSACATDEEARRAAEFVGEEGHDEELDFDSPPGDKVHAIAVDFVRWNQDQDQDQKQTGEQGTGNWELGMGKNERPLVIKKSFAFKATLKPNVPLLWIALFGLTITLGFLVGHYLP